MLITARRITGVQTVVMNGNCNNESYDSVLVGTENRKVLSRCLKTASDGDSVAPVSERACMQKLHWHFQGASIFLNVN